MKDQPGSLRERFSDSEWELLLEVPPLIGSAVMLAGRSGLGSIKEAVAAARGVIGGERTHPDSELVRDLAASRREGARSEVEKFGGRYLKMQPAEVADEALRMVGSAVTLLGDRVAPEESQDYARWVMEIADRVAHAAKEGDFLGFGGQRVSSEEQSLLDRIRSALFPK